MIFTAMEPKTPTTTRLLELFGSSPEVLHLYASPLPDTPSPVAPPPPIVNPLPAAPLPISPGRWIPSPQKLPTPRLQKLLVRIPRRLRPPSIPEYQRYRLRLVTPEGTKWLAFCGERRNCPF